MSEQVEAAFALSAEERAAQFVEQVAATKQVWALENAGGFVVVPAGPERAALGVWPSAELAQAVAKRFFPDATPTAIPLEFWMLRWLPGLAQDGHVIAVFPALDLGAAIMEPAKLGEELRAELEWAI